jgi:starch synthase
VNKGGIAGKAKTPYKVNMNLLVAANELEPFTGTTLLGSAVLARLKTLKKQGHEVAVVMPLHRCVREAKIPLKRSSILLPVTLGSETIQVPVWEAEAVKGIPLFALQKDEFFDRSGLYGNDHGDYADNATRFAFFSRAVVELTRYIDPTPDTVEVHDWHAGMVPVYLKNWGYPIRSHLVIHNPAFQGNFNDSAFEAVQLPSDYFSPEGIEFYGRINYLKGAILFSDAIETARPEVSVLIVNEPHACGLSCVLQEHRHKIVQPIFPIKPKQPSRSKATTKKAKKIRDVAKKPIVMKKREKVEPKPVLKKTSPKAKSLKKKK